MKKVFIVLNMSEINAMRRQLTVDVIGFAYTITNGSHVYCCDVYVNNSEDMEFAYSVHNNHNFL